MATLNMFTARPQADHGTVHWFNESIKRGQRGVFTEIVTVSPGLASVILERNADNRHLKPVKAGHYTTDMIAGRWVFNGEPIIVSDTGELNDGQHRMQAVIDANLSMPFLFVFGVKRESRTTVDQGAARTASDYLSMDGVPNSALCAGLARLVMAYEDQNGQGLAKAKEYSNAQIVRRVKSDPAISEAAQYAQSVVTYTKGLILPSLVGAAFYILTDIDHDAAVRYLNQVCVGENIKRGDPAFAVRSSLTNLEATNRTARLEIIFRGWNAFRQNRRLSLAKSLGTIPAVF